MENYKGIYYKDTKEQKFYEGGAHFKYKSLFNILLSLGGLLPDENYNYNISTNNIKNINKPMKDLNSLLIKVEGKQSKFKTRNIAQFNYVNNPNTQIKQNSQNKHLHKKNTLSLKDYNSKNNNNYYFLNKKNSYYKRAITSISINDDFYKNNINNNLIQILFNKKRFPQKNEEKTSDMFNSEKYPNFNCSKFIHNRNRSDVIENNNKAFNNKINVINQYDSVNKSSNKNINKSPINKNNINLSNNIYSLEINGQDNNNTTSNNNKEEITNKNNINNLVYGKNKIALLKENSKINNHLSFYSNKMKKSRNIINKNIIGYNTNENNKINNDYNYKKKSINNNYFLNTYENNKKTDNDNLENKTVNNITSYNNNIFNAINIKNKEKILKSNGNNLIIQKYTRKKINQMCVFNQNNCKIKNRKNIQEKI